MTEKLDFDGERFTPENVREIWYEHMHRYAFAAGLVSGLEVLDAACGEGYGSAVLANSAASVTGVDISEEAIAHASRRYDLPNTSFRQADCCALPFEDHRFDCIVSFETLEHLQDHAGMLSEFRRVLKPSGFLLISSPDKAVYSDQQGFDNPFHVRELYEDEFRELLLEVFPVCHFYGQRLMFHSAIWPIAGPRMNDMTHEMTAHLQTFSGECPETLSRPFQPAMYLLAICAQDDQSLPRMEPALWLFDDEKESVYQHYQHEIRKNMEAGGHLAERDRKLENLERELSELRKQSVPKKSWLERLGLVRRS